MLVNFLSAEDKAMISKYRRAFAYEYGASGDEASTDSLLEEWGNCKSEYLYRMLGEKFIIAKEVTIQKTMEELETKIDNTLFNWNSECRPFIEAYFKISEQFWVSIGWKDEPTPMEARQLKIYNNMRSLIDNTTLATNVYSGESFEIPVNETEVIQVNSGCKASKVIGKIAKAFHMSESDYEVFRIAHSRCLNEKTLKGTLCLSIHPLDYMTMSDNDCGWSSCMSWTEGGEYRRGTVEMMNSPMVVVAYLMSGDIYSPCQGVNWNSKKWRELFIITPAVITGIKGYPYWNRDIEHQTIMWLRELVQTNLQWGPYNCEPQMMHPGEACRFDEFDKSVTFRFYTGAMYNDFYDSHAAIISHNCAPRNDINYSGASQCMFCGALNEEFDGEGLLCCYECNDAHRCAHCGDLYAQDDLMMIDGEWVCEYCAEHMPICEVCGNTHVDSYTREIHLATENGVLRGCTILVCEMCIDDLVDPCLAKIQEGQRNWSYYRYIRAADASEKVLSAFGFDSAEEVEEWEGARLIPFSEFS